MNAIATIATTTDENIGSAYYDKVTFFKLKLGIYLIFSSCISIDIIANIYPMNLYNPIYIL
jgi:hypothetical protein